MNGEKGIDRETLALNGQNFANDWILRRGKSQK